MCYPNIHCSMLKHVTCVRGLYVEVSIFYKLLCPTTLAQRKLVYTVVSLVDGGTGTLSYVCLPLEENVLYALSAFSSIEPRPVLPGNIHSAVGTYSLLNYLRVSVCVCKEDSCSLIQYTGHIAKWRINGITNRRKYRNARKWAVRAFKPERNTDDVDDDDNNLKN